jgi:hypothetical protein
MPDRPRATSRLDRAAEIAGRSLGRAARAISSLKARHPDPLAEASEGLRAGRERVKRLAAQAKGQSTAVAKKTKSSMARARSSAAGASRKTAKALSSARRSTNAGVKRTKAIVKRVQKAASRRLKGFKR